MGDKYSSERLYKLFFEDYFENYKEEFNNILEELLKDEKLNKIIIDIVNMEDKGLFGQAYVKAHNMMHLMLEVFIIPRMNNKENIDMWDVAKFLFKEGEDEIANYILGINSDMYIFAEDEDAGEPKKNDVSYIIYENCQLYKMLSKKYGKDKI